MEDRENITFGHVRMFVLGSFVGAAAALLFAPKSGREMRSDIKDRAGKLKSSASENWQQISTKGREVVDKVSTRGQEVVGRVSQRSQEIYGKASDSLGEQKERIGAALTAGKSAAKEAYTKKDDASAAGETNG